MNWVVRAGIVTDDRLIAGYREHLGQLGTYGFSVQYHPGATIEQLCLAGRFPNKSISFASDDAMMQAVDRLGLGYQLRFIKTPGQGFHFTTTIVLDAQGIVMTSLEPVVGSALAQVFTTMPNPHPFPKP